MSEPQSTLASASAAAVGVLATSQLPSHLVIMGALLGALISVWISQQRDPRPWSYLTLVHIAGQLGVSAACGIVISTILSSLAPHYGWASPFRVIPEWAIAATVAAVIHVIAPVAYGYLLNRAGIQAQKEVAK